MDHSAVTECLIDHSTGKIFINHSTVTECLIDHSVVTEHLIDHSTVTDCLISTVTECLISAVTECLIDHPTVTELSSLPRMRRKRLAHCVFHIFATHTLTQPWKRINHRSSSRETLHLIDHSNSYWTLFSTIVPRTSRKRLANCVFHIFATCAGLGYKCVQYHWHRLLGGELQQNADHSTVTKWHSPWTVGIRIRIFTVPWQVYKEIRLSVHSKI